PGIDAALALAIRFLTDTQRPDGTWIPLWFGHQQHPTEENPLYGTARVLPALASVDACATPPVAAAIARALGWLVAQQNADGGWSGAPGAASSVEETGVAVEALAVAWQRWRAPQPEHVDAIRSGAEWLARAVETEAWRTPSPIGFYFAKLWYFERLYPLIFATGALTQLARLR
ncbi:MAG: prenyltransferase/squalene oxidase repeat-containing protein, partial [Opitutaceae bacterium]